MNSVDKISILNLISEEKEVLFGRFSCSLTHEQKMDTWKRVTEKAKAIGAFTRDWKYLRDTTWQNWRKRTIILPRGVSGDVYNLADCILQQALVGPGPNQLVVSYLRHSLSSQLVSYAAVLQRISKYDGFHKPHCIVSLLEFLETIQGGITCRSKPEEGLLATAVLSIVQWLLGCMMHALKNTTELRAGSVEYSAMLDKPASILNELLGCDFMVAMCCLAKHETLECYHDVLKKCQELEALLNQNAPIQPSTPVIDNLRKLRQLEVDGSQDADAAEDSSEPVTYCLQALLAVEVLQNPSADTHMFVSEALMVKRLKGYSTSRLYCEIIRACLMSLNDMMGTNEESNWGAFLFLKVPHILRQLHFTLKGESAEEKQEFSQDVVDAFDLLLQYTPLLDVMDVKCSSNCIECLLNELVKIGLVSETHVAQYNAKREPVTAVVQRPEPSQSTTQSLAITKVIIRADSTLAKITKTLDADYGKVQDALLSVLCQVLTGKSFELILSVATVEGKLRTFVTKLIKFNECSKQVGGESGKTPHTRALLFDVSFLMLCSIVQTYGSEVVLSEESGQSFFEQWVRECMVERGQPKFTDQMMEHCDQAKVDALLAQFNSPDSDFKMSVVKWHEVCMLVPSAIREVLIAWEHGVMSANDVKRILDAMRSRMCCLPVCAAAWLCSYMQVQHQDALLKPMNMVQQFLMPLTNDEVTQQDTFKERSSLMFQVIRKMQYDIFPPTPSKSKVMTSHTIKSRQPSCEQLEAVWAGIQARGWVNSEAAHALESLLNTGGSHWFVCSLVQEVLKFRYQEVLDRAVDLAFAVFHLDIEHCTLALLLNVLPRYLHNSLQSEELVEPQASALAKLCAYCVYAALEFQNTLTPAQSNSQKRNRREVESDDMEGLCPTAKLVRTSASVTEAADTASLFGAAPGSSTPGPTCRSLRGRPAAVREPLRSALRDLFRSFALVAGRDGDVSQQTHFVCRFLHFVVQSGRDRTRLVLHEMPNTLVPCLLKSLPDLFTTDLLLRLYDLQTPAGRKDTARDLCVLRNMSFRLGNKTV